MSEQVKKSEAKKEAKKVLPGMMSNIDVAVLHDMNLTREQIAKSLKTDVLQGMAALEVVLYNEKVFAVMVDEFWNRYLTLKDKHLAKNDLKPQ